ncbi:MAG: UDP-N-acetylglucosamine 2-epimerase (non-hydrolyzing) [Lachnospiraceae bacterium]|nr:UDP-N-acetylglucosamine 2-epimerase (non-hydrolyzing) [Lachnospiraceae bacterium]
MSKLKLVTILGTRPEIIRLSEVIKCADRYFDHMLVHTGQNYDRTLNQIFFEELKLREPDVYLNCVGDDLGQTMGNIIAKTYELLAKEKPDALLILGDTNSALCAISAKRLKIPIFHMEAGNRCWDWNVSEMINRKIVDHISDINLPYTEHSRRYLLSEGIDGKTIFVTGSPMKEVIKKHMDEIERSDVLNKLGLEKERFILVSAHREENIDIEENFMELMNSINEMAKIYDMPVIYSTHPRTRKFIEKRGFVFDERVQNLEPFGYFEYNKLQKNAYLVLSDSGTLSEESAMLDFPAVLIRTSTERPEVLDKGTVVIGGIKSEDVLRAAALSRTMYENGEKTVEALDYADENVSVKVIKLIESYAKIVNETVWLKR